MLIWCLAVSTSLAIVYAPHNTMKDNPHEWSKGEKVVFGSLRWFLFSMSVGWVIFACEYGYAGRFSFKVYMPLSICCKFLQFLFFYEEKSNDTSHIIYYRSANQALLSIQL